MLWASHLASHTLARLARDCDLSAFHQVLCLQDVHQHCVRGSLMVLGR